MKRLRVILAISIIFLAMSSGACTKQEKRAKQRKEMAKITMELDKLAARTNQMAAQLDELKTRLPQGGTGGKSELNAVR